ncbi:MAG: hypothetical protein U1B78_04210 [Dehalococcoidia bacterium]|nr:hypothetical protein [Dehalococcoidia bacterium]MDZ4278323.1 hypothetical protein [Dehalococcoidia bacterium]
MRRISSALRQQRLAVSLAIAGLAVFGGVLVSVFTVFGGGDDDATAREVSRPQTSGVLDLQVDVSPSPKPKATQTTIPPGEGNLEGKFAGGPGAAGTPGAAPGGAPGQPGAGGGASGQPSGGGPGQPAGDGSPGQPTDSGPPSGPPTEPPPGGFSISIVSPQNGATVPPTFTLQITASGIELALGPGGALIPGAGHWHYGIDTVLLPEPHDVPSLQIGPLSPGPHTITVTLNLNDVDLTVVAAAQIQITVSG